MDDDLEAIKKRQMREMMLNAQRAALPAVTDLDNESFDAFVSSNALVLVDFWAQWCGPCKSMHSIYETLAGSEMRARFVRVNVDAAPQIAGRYGVQSIPTFVMFKDGAEADRMTGAVSGSDLRLLIEKHAPRDESGRR